MKFKLPNENTTIVYYAGTIIMHCRISSILTNQYYIFFFYCLWYEYVLTLKLLNEVVR